MPALQMKAKLSTVSLIDKKFLGVCEKSGVIAKRSCTHTTYSRPTTESELCIQKCLDASVSSRMDLQTPDDENGKVICLQEMPIGEDLLFQNQSLMSVDSCTMRRMEFINCTSNLETIFSHLEPTEAHSAPNIDDDAGFFGRYLSNFPETNGSEIKFSEIEGSNNDLNVPGLKADGGDDNTKVSNCQTCNVSDFFISDMIITGLPFDGNTVDDITKTNPLHDYKCTEPNMFFDVADECMILPFLEDTAKVSDSNDTERWESVVTEPDSSNLYLAIHQIRSCNQDPDLNTNSGQTEDFDPQSFIRSLPELTDVVPKFEPITLPNESGRRKSTTLVLDLDETLVHSALEHCDDADFTFTIFFNMKEHIVYVKQRPYLHAFLERVADMFEVVIFTASQSIYAGQLLDILDPEKKLISRRVYRESCIFSDGTYTKDLTVLGVDLAKVAIIDNSPQVFRLQVNNGIPIKSWFSDPSDCALIALLPFLEMLVDADDVRPIIAKRFGNRD